MVDNCYQDGDSVRLEIRTKDDAGVLTDPTTVTLKIKPPNGAQVTFTEAGGGVTKISVGHFRRDHVIPVAEVGTWTYRYQTTGAIVAAEEKTFTVEATVMT